MAKRGSFLQGTHVRIRVIGGDELQIAFDMSHDPWKVAGLKVLESLKDELDLLEEETEALDQIIELLKSKNGSLN